MSVDLAEFEALDRPESKAGPCPVAAALDELDGADKDALRAAMAAAHISNKAVAKWLAIRGAENVKWQHVRNHRAARCRCANE